MEDLQIYELATQVLDTLSREMNAGIYAELGGTLSQEWDPKPLYSAYAKSMGSTSEPPRHVVVVHYELVRQMWRDAEEFCEFATSIPSTGPASHLFDQFEDTEKLPGVFSVDEHVRNMFVAVLTWVFFHELGHLMQEHGHIRNRFGMAQADQSNDVRDIAAAGDTHLAGNAAVVSHVTELAADFEATHWYLSELIRHLLEPDFVEEENRGEVLAGLVYLMICGISIVFFRFNGNRPLSLAPIPLGSHPHPLVRLEVNVPHIFEFLDIQGVRDVVGQYHDRKQLVELCAKASLCASLYWSMRKTTGEFDNRLRLQGLMTNPVTLEYFDPIVVGWDAMLPEIERVRRFGSPFGLLSFTEEFRERIKKRVPWGQSLTLAPKQ